MRISVIGVGYVGLAVAVGLSKLGNEVTAIDNDQNKLKAINNKTSPIYEQGLSEILNQVHIETTSDYYQILNSNVIFICVETPSNEDGSISLRSLIEATKQIASVLRNRIDYCVIIVKSTVVPGTTEGKVIPILEESAKRVGSDFGVCMIPEFLREGKAISDFLKPDRVVIGEYDKKSGDTISALYQEFDAPILRTNLKTAEMIKYASNAFLATRLSFINEIGNICKRLDIDTYQVAKGMGYDDRIGSKYLNAGIGFGGACLPKDVKALIAKAKEIGYDPQILKEVLDLNDKQPLELIKILKKHIPTLKDKQIGILGLTFNPNTDDVRESRAIKVIEILLQEGAVVKAYDPVGINNFKKLFPYIEYVSKEDILSTCEAVLILTLWQEFEDLDYRGKIVIDGRRISKAKGAIVYEGICW